MKSVGPICTVSFKICNFCDVVKSFTLIAGSFLHILLHICRNKLVYSSDYVSLRRSFEDIGVILVQSDVITLQFSG